MMPSPSEQQGFTLIEILLSVGIITLLVGLSLPLYETFTVRNDADTTATAIASSLRRAETYARANTGDSQWGVEIISGAAVVFEGATYASRVTTADEPTAIPASLSTSGLTDIVFAKLTGYPSTTGSITLTTVKTNDTRTVTINAKGLVTY